MGRIPVLTNCFILLLGSVFFYTVHGHDGRDMSVIVVGAGVSGLSAATRLIKAGFSVTVLEAGDYVGGRVKTGSLGDYPIEIGAEWVHGWIGNSVFEIMKDYDVFDLKEQEDNTTMFHISNLFATQLGEILDSTYTENMQALLDFENEDKDLEWRKESESYGEYATRRFRWYNILLPVHERESIRNASLNWLERLTNIEDSADTWFDTSNADDYEYLEGHAETAWKPPATYSSFLKVILGQSHDAPSIIIPDWIMLNRKVDDIQYSMEEDIPIRVTCSNGEIYEARHVISTVSLGVLKENHLQIFKPELPQIKQKAIEHLGFGTVNKIYMEFETAWWLTTDANFTGLYPLWEKNETNYSSAKEFPSWVQGIESFKIIDSGSHPTAIAAWISGADARHIESLPLDDVVNSAFEVLTTFLRNRFPDIPRPIRATRSTWFSNPFFRGSYSFRRVESDVNDVWPKDLAAPVPNSNGIPILMFAGEATNDHHYSTVHAAYDTGRREAERLIQLYQSNDSKTN